MKKYIIFDLDWTLISSESKIKKRVLNFIKEKEKDSYDKARYLITKTQWMPLKDFFFKIVWNKNKAEKYSKDVYKILWHLRKKTNFFPWAKKKIKELSKKYKLFLSTWSSTKFAKDILKDGWIKDYFELIYWSDIILKWQEHLDIFADYSWDKHFFKKSIYIWDWDMDRVFAKNAKIDFIHIWNEKKDRYEIKSIIEIDNILKILNKKWK